MKKITAVFILALTFLMTACGGPGQSDADFDGGYVWTSGDKYMPLTEVQAASTQIAKGGMSISALMRAPKYYYVLDNTPTATLSSDDLQGVFVKGDYAFKNFSLHKLEEKTLAENEGLFENKGPATKDQTFYFAGEQIDLSKKSDESNNGYFFKVSNELAAGKYVAWVNSSFWIFEVN
ncbi:hypothetical protein [Paraglaciecola aestuariivivens]